MYVFAIILLVILNICTIAFLSKYIFSDLKRRSADFEEKTGELFKMYEDVEGYMETFYTESDALKTKLEALAADVAELKTAIREVSTDRSEYAKKGRRASAAKPKPSAPSSWDLFGTGEQDNAGEIAAVSGESGGDAAEIVPDAAADIPRETRLEGVLKLHREGKTHSQIAKELGVTKNEVDLIIKMY
jgi:hypothetical protein